MWEGDDGRPINTLLPHVDFTRYGIHSKPWEKGLALGDGMSSLAKRQDGNIVRMVRIGLHEDDLHIRCHKDGSYHTWILINDAVM
jgi:hypothetical protein